MFWVERIYNFETECSAAVVDCRGVGICGSSSVVVVVVELPRSIIYYSYYRFNRINHLKNSIYFLSKTGTVAEMSTSRAVTQLWKASPALAKLINAETCTRPDVVKKVWEHIK
jgi:hypothetical protein